MANPFGYGDLLGYTHAQYSNAVLFPKVWVDDAMRLAMPSVYFPQITPTRTELMANNGQNIVVPLDGAMNDTSWPGLTVGTSITVGSHNVDSINVTISEAGRGLAMDRAVGQFVVNGMNPNNAQNYVRQLAANFAMSWENTLREIYLGGDFALTQVAVGSFYKGGVWKDSGGTGFAVGGTITDAIVDESLLNLRTVKTGTLGTFIVPPMSDGLYRFVGNWNTLKGIAASADFKALDTRTSSDGNRSIFQEIGPWNGFMFVRHDLMPDGTCLAMGANVAVQAFGGQFDDSDIPAEDMTQLDSPVPFQVRLERDWQGDFYRGKAAAWYTMAGSSAALRDTGTHAIRVHVAT